MIVVPDVCDQLARCRRPERNPWARRRAQPYTWESFVSAFVSMLMCACRQGIALPGGAETE